MRNKPLLLLVAFFALNFLLSLSFSCKKTDDDITGFGRQTYCIAFDSMEVAAVKGPSLYSGTELREGQTLSKGDSLHLYLTFYSQQVVCYQLPERNPFMNSANALTPPPPSYSFKDSVVQVSITSDNDFDNTYTKGQELIGLFDIKDMTQDDLGQIDYSVKDYLVVGHHRFQLRQYPATTGKHRFTVKYQLASGKIVIASSVLFTIQV